MIRGISTTFILGPSREWRIEGPVAPPAPVIEAPGAPEPPPAPAGKIGPEIVQLVAPYDAAHFPKRGAIVEHKHDGWRAAWIKGQLLTRTGLPIWNTAHLWPALDALQATYGEPVIFDGEYIECGSFAKTAKACTAGIHAGGPIPGDGVLHLFDAIPVSVWEGREAGLPLVERKRLLAAAIAGLYPCAEPHSLRFVDHWPVASAAAAERIAADIIRAGGEGAVVKDPHSLHYAGRGRAWQKIKTKLTLDLQVIGHGPMKAEPDLLGFILCDYQGRGVKVAHGFTDDERIRLYHYPEKLAGRIAEIEAMEVLDSGALRSARFIRWRDDLGPGDIGGIRGRLGQ
jgi:DNA ligase-1